MAVTSFIYGQAVLSVANKEVDFDTDALKVMLCTSAYVPNRSNHRYKSSITGEVTGAGYTAGGKTLQNVSRTYEATLNQVRIFADPVVWGSSTLTARYAVIYDDTPAVNKPLIGYIDFGQDMSSNNSNLEITFNALGAFRLAPGILTDGQPDPELPEYSPSAPVPGTWQLKFNDDFTTGLNATVWTPYWLAPNTTYRNAITDPSNVTVSGGEAQLTLAASGHGAVMTSNPYDNVPGHTGFAFGYGYVEARIWIPGPSATAAYNWVGMSVRGQNWPTDGQADIVETAGWEASGGFTANYHWDSDGSVTPVGTYTYAKAGSGNVAGSWGNGWHIFGLHRRTDGINDWYWDGVKVWSTASFDGGRPQYLVFNVGQSTANNNYGASSTMRIDYVRQWDQVTGGTPLATTAAERYNWGPVVRGDEFNYSGAPDPAKWSVYNGPGHAGNGTRTPTAWSGNGSVMRCSGDANGNTGGMSALWDRNLPLYFRLETRMRTSARYAEYHPVCLLWPDNAGNVISGVPEVDYAEGTGDITKIKFFLHYGTSSQTQAERVIDTTQWHNYAVEWGPNAVVGYIDGEEWFRDTNTSHIPSIPMHSTLQLDWFPGDSPDTNPTPSWVEFEWTRGYNYQ